MDEKDFNELINALKDEDSDVRKEATKALIGIGKPAVRPLIKALNNEYSSVQRGAAEALGEIGDAQAVKPLTKVLKDKNTQSREEIVEALEKLGWTPRDDTEKAYYLVTKKQWSELDRLGEAAVIPLIQALKEKDDNVRLKVVEVLGDIYLIQTLKHKNILPEKLQKRG